MLSIIEEMYQKEDLLVKRLTNELKRYPKGSLEVQSSKKENRWYWKCTDKAERRRWGKKISKTVNAEGNDRIRLHPEDHEIVTGVRNRKICQVRLKRAERNRKWLKCLMEHYQPSDEATVVQSLKEPYKSLTGFEQYISGEKLPVQSENPYHREQLIHKNSIGEMYRSKAEMQISELLLSRGIPYRYELKLEMPNGEKKYPDFAVKKPGSEGKKYIEYFGMIENEEYAESMKEKIKWYLNHGFVPGKNVLFLYETSTSGMDLAIIYQQIHQLLDM